MQLTDLRVGKAGVTISFQGEKLSWEIRWLWLEISWVSL